MKIASIVTILWLAVQAGAAGESGGATAHATALIETYQFDFDADLNADAQPDSWTRTIDANHPHYVPAGLDFTTAQAGKASLRIKGDGAGVEYVSPKIEIEPTAAYDIMGYVKTEGLTAAGPRRSLAYIEARLYDKADTLLAKTRCFPELSGTSGWKEVSVSDVSDKASGKAWIEVAVGVEGLSLTGNAWFDSIEVRKRPVGSLRTNRWANCFYWSDRKEVFFEAKGLSPGKYTTKVGLVDATGAGKHSVELDSTVSTDGALVLSYALPGLEVGPYTIELELSSSDTALMSQSVRMGVLPDRTHAETAKNFGVLFSTTPLPSSSEYELTYLSGCGWAKMPLAEIASSERSRYLRTVSELRRNGVTPAGVLAFDAANAAEGAAGATDALLALFTDTINAFAGSVVHWQLGADEGGQATSQAAVQSTLAEVAKFARAVSYNAKLGVPVTSAEQLRAYGKGAVDFFALGAGETAGLEADSDGAVEYWTWIDPATWLTGGGDPLSKAAEDISAAFADGATVLFLKDPWKTRGILDGEGNVTPFMLALVNLINQLSNHTYAGAIEFPDKTPNAVFTSVEDTKVVVWPGAEPAQERIFLGESVGVISPYGVRSAALLDGGENIVSVKDTVSILTGVDPAVVETRKTFSIEPAVIDSVYEVQPIHISFTNTFATAIMGELALTLPQGWEAQPRIFFVRLRPGETFHGRANLVVPYNALSGEHEITATLQVGEAGLQKITLVQRRELASRTFKMEIETRASGTSLLVYQKVTNVSERPADVSAFLEAEGMDRVERLPRRIEPGASTTFSYTIGDPASLGTKRLRASVREARTNRFLNSEFTVGLPGR